MLIINNNHTNPYFNLATEEYLLKKFNENIFMLWRNEPSIIVGKNQNTLAEINLDYVTKHNIPVVRRLTGGGAVFHDLGNINFTFIETGKNSDFNNFRKFVEPIIDVLKSLSINAEFSGRNDITIDGKKFSGNAQCSYNHKVMHHGTLLFCSEIKDISDSLKVKPVKFEGKGVKSVASRVTNISEHLCTPISITEFEEMVKNYMMNLSPEYKPYDLSEDDIRNINEMVELKYGTWDWNFGSSPEYTFSNAIKYSGGNVEFNINVNKGTITDIKIFGDFFGKKDIKDLEMVLTGVKHNVEDIKLSLAGFDINDYFAGASLDEILKGLI